MRRTTNTHTDKLNEKKASRKYQFMFLRAIAERNKLIIMYVSDGSLDGRDLTND